MEPNIFLSKKEWKKLNPEEFEQYLESVFNYYRNVRGFPYYPVDKSFRDKKFSELMKFDTSHLFLDDIIKQTMHGLALAWSYFPHSWEIHCNNLKTPYDIFHDDDAFRGAIRKRTRMGDNMSDSGIRKMMKIYTGTQSVSNFRPTSASVIYDRYSNGGIVWDMSGGFGGRLLGAIKSGIKRYIATDPSTKTYEGLIKINEDYGNGIGEIYKLGSEDYIPDSETLDLCFSSPPYFDTEKYSEEESQSYKKFPDKELWRVGFLKKTFDNCYIGLKPNKHMIINVANTKNYKTLEEDTIRTALEVGFKHIDTLKLSLSCLGKGNVKYEPMFVFQK